MVVATAFVMGSCGLATPAQAKSNAVKIGQDWVARDLINPVTYYRAKRAVSVVERVELKDKTFTRTVRIPKSTVVAGELTYVDNQKKMSLLIDRHENLSYHIVRSAYHKLPGNLVNVQMLAAKRQDFRRISRPAYMPTWSYGDLYLGSRVAAVRLITTQKVQVTTDGYLETHTYSPKTGETTPKPLQSAKINRTRVKGATRYLYFSKKIKGLALKHVAKHGRMQYRLALKNRHQPQHVAGFSDNDEPGVYYSLYQLGNKTYYTPIAVDIIY